MVSIYFSENIFRFGKKTKTEQEIYYIRIHWLIG